MVKHMFWMQKVPGSSSRKDREIPVWELLPMSMILSYISQWSDSLPSVPGMISSLLLQFQGIIKRKIQPGPEIACACWSALSHSATRTCEYIWQKYLRIAKTIKKSLTQRNWKWNTMCFFFTFWAYVQRFPWKINGWVGALSHCFSSCCENMNPSGPQLHSTLSG